MMTLNGAVIALVFAALLAVPIAAAGKVQRFTPARFSADFPSTPAKTDLPPSAETESYITRTSVYEVSNAASSYSVTVRQYRYGAPNTSRLAKIIISKLDCSAVSDPLSISAESVKGLAMHGNNCLHKGLIFYSRILTDRSWYYQALAVVPADSSEKAIRFVQSLKVFRDKPAVQSRKELRKKPKIKNPARRPDKAKRTRKR